MTISASRTHRKEGRLAQVLLFVNAAVWLGLGVTSLLRMTPGPFGHTTTAWVIAILMFGNAGAMLVTGIGLGWKLRLFCYLGMAVLVVNIILSVTDEVGFVDLVTLAFDLVILGLLIVIREKESRIR